jgi:ribosomal protein S18 acetylase RimI-like enzyme
MEEHAITSFLRELVVKELTPSLRDDFLTIFDTVAFVDNPDWSDCYCSAYHFANKGKAESRREASSLVGRIGCTDSSPTTMEKPVGWCNSASPGSYPGVQWLMGLGPDKSEKVGSIVCFVIASTHRKQRVASQLLNAACNKFSEKGLEYAEAYPVKKQESAAYNFPGPLSMYLKNASAHIATLTGMW